MATNNRGPLEPYLWLLRVHNLSVQVISISSQQLTISCDLDSIPCVFSWVYAKTTYIEQRVLTEELRAIFNSHGHTPWIVLGDFNCALGAHEKNRCYT